MNSILKLEKDINTVSSVIETLFSGYDTNAEIDIRLIINKRYSNLKLFIELIANKLFILSKDLQSGEALCISFITYREFTLKLNFYKYREEIRYGSSAIIIPQNGGLSGQGVRITSNTCDEIKIRNMLSFCINNLITGTRESLTEIMYTLCEEISFFTE